MPARASRFRSLKALIRPWLKNPRWSRLAPLPPDTEDQPPAALVSPLFACLPEGGDTTDRAAYALGGVMARLHDQSPEDAKNVVRRFLWHMNEESGNIGWGIPEAFGETLARCPALADIFHRVLFSYIHDKPGDSTFCDHAPLRRSCFRAMDIVLAARPDLIPTALPLLRLAARDDDDEICRALSRDLEEKYS